MLDRVTVSRAVRELVAPLPCRGVMAAVGLYGLIISRRAARPEKRVGSRSARRRRKGQAVPVRVFAAALGVRWFAGEFGCRVSRGCSLDQRERSVVYASSRYALSRSPQLPANFQPTAMRIDPMIRATSE